MNFYPLWVIGILIGMLRVSTELQLPSVMTQDYSEGLQNSHALPCETWKENGRRMSKKSSHQRSPYILKRQLNSNNKWPYILWRFLGIPLPLR